MSHPLSRRHSRPKQTPIASILRATAELSSRLAVDRHRSSDSVAQVY
jgi:hypothetical protein